MEIIGIESNSRTQINSILYSVLHSKWLGYVFETWWHSIVYDGLSCCARGLTTNPLNNYSIKKNARFERIIKHYDTNVYANFLITFDKLVFEIREILFLKNTLRRFNYAKRSIYVYIFFFFATEIPSFRLILLFSSIQILSLDRKKKKNSLAHNFESSRRTAWLDFVVC